MFTMTLLLIYYLNFKLGCVAGSGVAGAARGARPRLLLPLELLGVGRVGRARPDVRVGVDRGAVRHGDGEGRREPVTVASRSWALTSPILLLALVPLFGNWQPASRAGHTRHATSRPIC